MLLYLCILFACSVSCAVLRTPTDENGDLTSEAIGNFSLELLYHTIKNEKGNIIMAPFTVWSALAALAEGALGSTRTELCTALRISKSRTLTRTIFRKVVQGLPTNTTAVQLAHINAIFTDTSNVIERDFREVSKAYDTYTFPVDFKKAGARAAQANQAVSVATKGLINRILEEDDFSEPEMIITTAVYFKGQWTAAFNASSTSKRPFHDSNGVPAGEVNMMYNRFTYSVVDMEDLQASVIELPYGAEEPLSLLVMLPKRGVSLLAMYRNLQKVPLATVVSRLRLYKQEHGNDEVDCYIPRLKVQSNLQLKKVLEEGLGIYSLFDKQKVNLGRLARLPLYATKFVQRAGIEVTEEGIPGLASAPELTSLGDVPKFEANRPFMYLIIEKTTSVVLLAGLYQRPDLY